MKQVEIGGVIIEYDEKAFFKQELKVGDTVSVLYQSEYQNEPKLYKGVVTEILPFNDEDPCINIMYVDTNYSSVEIKHVVITKKVKDYKIIKTDNQFIALSKENALDLLNKDIDKKEQEWKAALEKKEYFLQYYGKFIEKDAE